MANNKQILTAPITLNKGQENAITKIKHWYNFDTHNKPYISMSGAAGTGKTTVIIYAIQALNLKLSDIMCAAYVGKAVTILASNGLPAKTIHSTIFHRTIGYTYNADGSVRTTVDGYPILKSSFTLKESLDKDYKLLIIDEASMVDERLEANLLSFGVPIIFVGDHNQLPPIFGQSRVMIKPDIILNEIMRQDKDNPIIMLAHRALHGFPFVAGVYGDSRIMYELDLGPNLIRDYDSIIVAKNKTREMFNNHIRYRLLHAKSPLPMNGEKLVCRQNNWDVCLGGDFYLTNGTMGIAENIEYNRMHAGSVPMTYIPDLTHQEIYGISLDTDYIQLPISEQKEYGMSRFNKFEYGYATTAYMSQGSEYPRVLFVDERFRDEETTRRLRYTAITRASKQIDVLIVGKRL